METNNCQSCGMPLQDDEHRGTEKDGTLSDEYCCWCYKEGAYVQDLTMDGMIEHCVQFLDDFNKDSEAKFTKEEAVAQMKQYFPMLKRWKN